MNMETLELKGDRVLVLQLEEEKKRGELYLPDSVVDRMSRKRSTAWRAQVVSWGPGVDMYNLRHELKKGDKVLIAPVALDCPKFEVREGDVTKKYFIVVEEDLLGLETQEE